MNKADRLPDYLQQMEEGARDALHFVAGMSKETFLADKRTQRAVMMSLMIIGEAAAQAASVAPELTTAYPRIPWQNMRGMRNRIAHGYFEVDLDLVWTTAVEALPGLIAEFPALREWRPPGAR